MKPWGGQYLSLEVPGLAEGRPSVMTGDKIILSHPDSNRYSTQYEGIVHELVLFCEQLCKWHDQEEWVGCRKYWFWDIGKNILEIVSFLALTNSLKFVDKWLISLDRVTYYEIIINVVKVKK